MFARYAPLFIKPSREGRQTEIRSWQKAQAECARVLWLPAMLALRSHIEALNGHCASCGGAFSQFKLDEDTVSIQVQAEGCKGAIVFRIATCYKTTAESVEEEHGTHVRKLAR